MDTRSKRKLIIVIIAFTVSVLALLAFYFLSSKYPSTQYSDKTVVIDNYSKYTKNISSDSFGYLGNYLYEFIKDPKQGVYHGTIVDDSYSYSPQTWFSDFTVKLVGSDISWKVSMQTIKTGEITGDINVSCVAGTGSCLSFSDVRNAEPVLQDILPISSSDYIIAQEKDNYNTLSVIYYDNDNIGKTKAIEKIKSLGFNPEDYTIKYFYGGR